MDLTHRFSVPAGLDEAWNAFNDLAALAPCFPGATITSINGDEFAGSVRVKLGPMALVYTGTGRYVSRDTTERRVVIEAAGKDKRGNGTATATVTARFARADTGTDVEVSTDLVVTGRPAQFGRGVIADVSDKLLEQFVTCVSGRFEAGLGAGSVGQEGSEPRSAAASDADELISHPVELGAPVGDVDADTPGSGPEAAVTEAGAPEARAPEPAAQGVAARPEPAATRVPPAPDGSAIPSPAPRPAPQASPTPQGPPRYTPPRNTARPDLDVLRTVVPVLLKRYAPALGGLLLAVAAVVTLVRRRRG